jgi:hypothetical protein
VNSAETPSTSAVPEKRDSLKSETNESEEDDVEKGTVKETEEDHVVSPGVADDGQASPASSLPSTAQQIKLVQRTITNKDGSKTVIEEKVGPDGSILSTKTTTISTITTTEAATSLDL